MAQHKWHKEIKAWHDGAEIEQNFWTGHGRVSRWEVVANPDWGYSANFRIKPQKEFKVGDRVKYKDTCGTFHTSVVTDIDYNDPFPIKADFEDGSIRSFTKDGRFWSNGTVSLFHDEPKVSQSKVNEFAHVAYWLCCGSVNPHQHNSFCSEANVGYPERCRFGTSEEHQKRIEKHTQPKESQYMYVYKNTMGNIIHKCFKENIINCQYLGKIKLEQEDE